MKYKGEMDLSYQDMEWSCIAVGATPLSTMLGPVNWKKSASSLHQAITVHQHHVIEVLDQADVEVEPELTTPQVNEAEDLGPKEITQETMLSQFLS